MSYYVEIGQAKGKAEALVSRFGATPTTKEAALAMVDDPARAVVVVKEAPRFDAAAFVFSAAEFEAFDRPDDPRPTTWLLMDRERAELLSGYRRSASA